jgi:hypothetical protein
MLVSGSVRVAHSSLSGTARDGSSAGRTGATVHWLGAGHAHARWSSQSQWASESGVSDGTDPAGASPGHSASVTRPADHIEHP